MNKHHKELGIKILKIIGIGALFTVTSILNPKFPHEILKHYLKRKFKENYSKQQLQNAVKYLKQKQFIAYANGEFQITRIGRAHLELAASKKLVIRKVKWDHKWRFVTFDIPEEIKGARYVFRRRLKELGFYNFQRSLFVNPYPCEQEVATLTKILKISPHVHLIIAERFENDRKLAKHFSVV